jgi:TP901 family phage tail tape measure protein
MADVNANIGVHIDTSAALVELKNLQRQLAIFHSSVAKGSAASAAAQKNLQTNLINSINATGKFSAQMGTVRTSTESFTHALETNKLSMREYFRYAGGATKTFGRLFKQEFDTIGKVAQERVKTMQTQYIKMGRDASGAMRAMSIRPNTLDMNDYATKTALAAQRQALLNQLLKQGSTNLLNFGKNTQWAGRQLMVGFTVPLAYFGSMAAKTFMDLEKQAIRFRRVYGDVFTATDETDKALADIQKLAEEFTKYGVAIADTMEMAADAAAMGKTGAELTAQVAQATRLAVLGGVEQAQALETTISVTNAFGVATEDLASKINFLNAVENQSVVSIEDLTIAIPKAGPVVKQLGGSVEDLAFFLTAMKEGGINASEGANALKSGLAALINPTGKAVEMLAGFGVNINAIVEGNMGNVRETVIDFAQALDTLDPLNRARAIEQLFGKFQFSRLSTLFQNVTKDGTQASKVLDLAGASVEELAIMSERELGVLEDAIGTDFKESMEQLKLAIAPIGKEFLKAVTPIAKAIGGFLEKFNDLGDGTKKFIVIATTLVGVIGPVLLMTFGLLANGVANIIKLFITMRSGFLRAGANSNILAQQTSYLNTEQLQAASVAASLNQAHTKLTQSFTIETSAVKLLRQAYVEATIAATNFARANPGMMMPGRGGARPKKLARGTAYVPGTGNKDTVPAVLTPGEAVIPRDVAQDPRFQPIIDAMVSGKLQGFSEGTKAVVAFGAHQPFTTAHEDIAIRGQALADADVSGKTQFIQYTSGGTAAKKGVVSLENRVQQIAAVTGSTPNVANDPFKLMEDLKNKGFNDVEIILGDEYKDSGVYDEAAKKSGIKLQKIILPRIMDENNVSATKLRDAVAAGDLETAEKLIAKGTPPELKKIIFDEIKQNYVPPKSRVSQSDKNSKSGLMSSKDAFAHVGKAVSVSAEDYIKQSPGLSEYDKARIRAVDGLEKAAGRSGFVTDYRGLGFAFDGELNTRLAKSKGVPLDLFEKEWLAKGPDKWNATKDRALVKDLYGSDSSVVDDAMLKKIKEEAAKKGGIVTDDLVKKAFQELPANVKSTQTYQAMNAAFETRQQYGVGKGMSHNPRTMEKKFKAAIEAGTIAKAPVVIIDGDATEYNGKTTPLGKDGKPQKLSAVLGDSGFELPQKSHVIVERTDSKGRKKSGSIFAYDPKFPNPIFISKGASTTRANVGRNPNLIPTETAKEIKKRLSAKSLAILKQVDADVKTSSMAKAKPTDFGTQVSPTTGRSFPVEGIGGVYEKDGKKVFVKPMLDEKSARAELNANTIARNVHGLSTPKQVMKVMTDPNNKKRKIIVLESDFDPKFSETDIKKKFTKDEYFKQLVAANLRVDKDLKMGNLGGDSLTDPGASGVFDKASGKRNFVANLPSMEEMARINLSGVKGDAAARSPFWFGNATADIAKGMTAQQYNDMMIAEIDRRIPRLEKTLATLDLTPEERPYYQAMLDRLKEGKTANWKEIHKLHTSILIKPDEKIEDEKTGKTKKPKTTSKPSNVKPSSGDPADKRMADKPKKGKRVVNVLKRGPRGTILPSASSAPFSQADQIRLKSAEEGVSLSTARRRLISSGELIEAINRQTAATDQATDTTKQTLPLTKEQLKEHKREVRSQKIGRVAGPLAGAAGIASMAGFMTGSNNVGMGMMGVSAIASIAPMLTNPIGIAVAAAATLAGGFFLLNKRMDDATKKQVAYVNSVTASTKKMQQVGELTKEIGASQIAQEQRETGARTNEFRTGYDREDNQFGTTFLSSEIGKEIFKGFNDSVAKDGPKSAKLLATQLAAYISDGVMSAEQANSVARAIGINLKDMSLSTSINGELRNLIGPDGQDLLTDPLKVRLNIVSSQAEMSNDLTNILKDFPTMDLVELESFVYGDVVAQAATANAKNLEIIQAQRDAQYQSNQEIIDGLEKQKATTTDKTKQLQLENQIVNAKAKQKSDDQILAEKSKQVIKDAEILYDLARKNAGTIDGAATASGKYIDALQAGIKAANPDDPFLNLFIERSAGLKTTQLEAQIDTAVLGGQLSIPTALKLMEMFAGTEKGEAQLKSIIETTLTTQDPGVFQTFMEIVSGKDIKPKITLAILTDKENFEDRVKVLNRLKDLDGDAINLEVFVNKIGEEGLDELATDFKAIEKIKSPITLDTVTNIKTITDSEVDIDMSGLVDIWSKYENATDEIKKTVIQEYIAVFKSIGDKEVEDLIKNELLSSGPLSPDRMDERQKRLEAKYYTVDKDGKRVPNAAAVTGALVSQSGVGAPNKIPGDGVLGGDVTPKQRNTTFDNILKDLKLTRDATINAQGGAKELMRILSGKKELTLFKGIEQQLSSLGANSDFIDFVGGLENAVEQKIIKINKKGVVSYGEFGKAAKKAYDEKQLGLFSAQSAQVINESIKQRNAFIKLKAAGVETADAQEMLADSIFATSLAAQKNPKEIRKMIAEYKNMQLQIQKTLEDTNPEAAFDIQMNKAMEYYDFLEKEARSAAKPEITRITDLIDANEKLINVRQREIEMQYDRPIEKLSQDLAIIDKAAQGINDKYDAQENALEQISKLNDEISQQERGRLTLADALSSGDISAAAAAAQQLRQDAAANAMQRSSGALQAARESELAGLTVGGLTRAQIEEKIYLLEQERLPLVAAITALQDKSYDLQVKELEPLQEALDARIENIDAARTAFDNQKLAIQQTGIEADKTNDKFKIGEGIVASVKRLWDDIKDKNVTITTTYVTAGGGGGGGSLTEEQKSIAGLTNTEKSIFGFAKGGLVPKYFANGGFAKGTDTVPSMLTPGEFVMRKSAVDKFGPMLSAMNSPSFKIPKSTSYSGASSGMNSVVDNSSAMYNYNIGITVPQSNANPNDIANAVIGQIKYIDAQRVRGQK